MGEGKTQLEGVEQLGLAKQQGNPNLRGVVSLVLILQRGTEIRIDVHAGGVEITSLQPPHCQLFGRRVLTRLSQEQSVSSPLEQALVTL